MLDGTPETNPSQTAVSAAPPPRKVTGSSQRCPLHAGGSRSFVRETDATQPDIKRLRPERQVLWVGLPGVLDLVLRQRTDLRFKLQRLDQSRPGFIEIPFQAQCPREPKMNVPVPGICRAPSSEQIGRLIRVP